MRAGKWFRVGGTGPYTSLKCVCSVQVIVLVNSGSGQFSVSLAPEESLCDGGWHTIASESLKTQTITLHLILVVFVFFYLETKDI